MELGENMMLVRKKKGLSQAELGKLIGTSGDVVGRYERGDIKPSIDVVGKIADALEVSLDYLVGKSAVQLDKQMLKRFQDISELDEAKRNTLFDLIDTYIRDAKVRSAHK